MHYEIKISIIIILSSILQTRYKLKQRMVFKMHSLLLYVLATIYLASTVGCQSAPQPETSPSAQTIHEKLFGRSLKGTWKISNSKQNILAVYDYINNEDSSNKQNNDDQIVEVGSGFMSFFQNTKGNVEMLMVQAEQNSKSPLIYMQLLNQKYADDKVIELSFILNKGYNRSVDQWKTPKFIAAARCFNRDRLLITYDIKLNYQMKAIPAEKQEDEQILISLISDSLNIDIAVKPVSYGLSYFAWITVINIVQIALLIYFSGSQSILANTSQWLILQNCLFLIFQSCILFKIALGYYDTSLKYFFLNFVTNLLVMMLVLWRFNSVIEKFVNKLYLIGAILFSLLYFYCLYFGYKSGGFWVIENMIFMWQIGYCVIRGSSGGISGQLAIVIILSRIPLYSILNSEDNLLKIRPDPLAFKFIVAILCLHLLVIWLQQQKGSRFFTPISLIPNYYNYLRETVFGSQKGQQQCSICLNKLREQANVSVGLKSAEEADREMQAKGKTIVKYVETKCGHSFHQSCLDQCMKSRLVCPMCRSELPPMNLGAA